MKKATKNKLKKITITLLPLLAFLFSAWILILGVRSYLNNASYFKIKKVVLSGLEDTKLAQEISRGLLYDSIFSLDINKIRKDLKTANPQFYEVKVIRSFPDQVVINVFLRKPLAQIEEKGFFLVDSEGVIVSDISDKPFVGLIVISGLNGISELSFGKKINLVKLKAGLRLVGVLKNNMSELISLIHPLINDKIKINIFNYPSFYVYFGDLELRFYDNGLDREVQSLVKILSSLDKKIKNIRYIDLRFAEPAVSFKNKR